MTKNEFFHIYFGYMKLDLSVFLYYINAQRVAIEDYLKRKIFSYFCDDHI